MFITLAPTTIAFSGLQLHEKAKDKLSYFVGTSATADSILADIARGRIVMNKTKKTQGIATQKELLQHFLSLVKDNPEIPLLDVYSQLQQKFNREGRNTILSKLRTGLMKLNKHYAPAKRIRKYTPKAK